MPEIRLDRTHVVAVIGELVAASVAEHAGMRLMPRSAARAARSIMREKPGADSGMHRVPRQTRTAIAILD